jgi:hypothetical protein
MGVDLTLDGQGLQATYTLTAPPNTSTGTFLLSLTAWSTDGEVGRQLGVKWIDGTPGAFAFDLVEAQNEDLSATPAVEGSQVRVTFPADTVSPLGGTWKWTAVTSVDGLDADTCPEPGDDFLNPQRQPFPG